MKEWTINFLNKRDPLVIKGDTFASAVNTYLETNNDLSYAILSFEDLSYTDLSGVNLMGADLTCTNLHSSKFYYTNLINTELRGADLTGANLMGANLTGANLDFSCLPLYCGSLDMKVDKRIACQLLYHTLRAMKSVDDTEVKAVLNDDKVLALANQFHNIDECGEIVKEQSNA